MELFVIIVNGFQPLTVITKCSILDLAAVLDSPLPRAAYDLCFRVDYQLTETRSERFGFIHMGLENER